MAEYAAKRNAAPCPTHPGELLREDMLPAITMGKSELAKAPRITGNTSTTF